MNKLELYLTIANWKDDIIWPKNSIFYGTKFGHGKIGDFRKNIMYTQNKMGLKDLYDSGRMSLIVISGAHGILS